MFRVDYITSIGPDHLLSRHNFAINVTLEDALLMTDHLYQNGTMEVDPSVIVSVIIQRQ